MGRVSSQAGSNWLAGTPSPDNVVRVLPGPTSTRFDAEGLLGELPY